MSTKGEHKRNPALRNACLVAADHTCARCGFPAEVAHHVHHLEDGGPDTLENLVALCNDCHQEWHRWGSRNTSWSEWGRTIPAWVHAAIEQERVRSEDVPDGGMALVHEVLAGLVPFDAEAFAA